jgi:hypothetical protein
VAVDIGRLVAARTALVLRAEIMVVEYFGATVEWKVLWEKR